GVPAVRTCPRSHLSLEHGQVTSGSPEAPAVEGSWAEFRCQPGFRLQGSARSNCTRSGRWS
ncbi:GABR1 protein, partial [Anthoscopus minutus]|nr:GABR1 protein [Anthoscopus minutus]